MGLGKGEGLLSLCHLGGKAPSWKPFVLPPFSPLSFVAREGNAVGNVKSPVALPLPLGAGFFVASYLHWSGLGRAWGFYAEDP